MKPTRAIMPPDGWGSYQTGDSKYGRDVSNAVIAAYGGIESSAQVAKRLGLPSRQVVIGMWSRARTAGLIEKIEKADAVQKPTPTPREKIVKIFVPRKDPAPVVIRPDEPIPINDGWGVAFDDLRQNHCRWPVGARMEKAKFFCGHPKKTYTSAYCPYHCGVAYVTGKFKGHTTPSFVRHGTGNKVIGHKPKKMAHRQ